MTQYCPECGDEVPADSKFCSNCGADLTGNEGGHSTGRQTGAGTQNDTGWDHETEDEVQWGEQTASQQRQTGQGDQWGTQQGHGGEQPPQQRIPRKNAVSTFKQGLSWATDEPVLIGGFVLTSAIGIGNQFVNGISLINLILNPIVTGAAFVVADWKLHGDRVDLGEAASIAAGRLLQFLAISFITIIAAAIGAIFLIIPGIYIGLRLALALPACVLDNQGVADSLSMSWEIAPGNLLKILGVTLIPLLFVFAIIPVIVAGVLAGSTGAIAIGILGGALIGGVTTAAVQMGLARIYIENR